jgi:outer membrane protein OmpA-like peptidoglycan-associated protein
MTRKQGDKNMNMRLMSILVLVGFLAACSSTQRKSEIEKEQYRRAQAEMQTVKEMIRSRQLPTIEFEFDSATLKRKSYPTLDKIVAILLSNERLKLAIEGHCDYIGSHEYNDQLSLMRAESVKRYITAKGVYPDSIRTYGYGKRRPVTNDPSSAGRALNRRVEIILLRDDWKSVLVY